MNRKTIAAGVAGAGAAGIAATAMLRRHDDEPAAHDSSGGDASIGTRAPELRRHLADMLGAQRHVLGAVRAQERDAELVAYDGVAPLVLSIRQILESHVAQTGECAEAYGARTGSRLKRMLASLSGPVTGVFGHFRNEPVSRMLRDDSVALTLLATSSGMLHTSALSLGDHRVSNLAEGQLRDLTPLIMQLSDLIPSVVIAEMAREGIDIDPTVCERATATVREAWTP